MADTVLGSCEALPLDEALASPSRAGRPRCRVARAVPDLVPRLGRHVRNRTMAQQRAAVARAGGWQGGRARPADEPLLRNSRADPRGKGRTASAANSPSDRSRSILGAWSRGAEDAELEPSSRTTAQVEARACGRRSRHRAGHSLLLSSASGARSGSRRHALLEPHAPARDADPDRPRPGVPGLRGAPCAGGREVEARLGRPGRPRHVRTPRRPGHRETHRAASQLRAARERAAAGCAARRKRVRRRRSQHRLLQPARGLGGGPWGGA